MHCGGVRTDYFHHVIIFNQLFMSRAFGSLLKGGNKPKASISSGGSCKAVSEADLRGKAAITPEDVLALDAPTQGESGRRGGSEKG